MPPLLSLPLLQRILLISALLLPSAICQPSDTSYRLVWSEEFNYAAGAQPSSTIWNWESGGGIWGNNELQYYTARPNNSYTNNSALVIQANYESYYGSPYTSARMNTEGKVAVYLGYIAVRARIAMSNSFWPAVWMIGGSLVGWPWSGEIDFMEQVNGMSAAPNSDDHTQYGTVHYNVGGINGYPNYTHAQQGGEISTANAATLWGDDWHMYAFEWTATSITFSVDGVAYGTACLNCTIGTNSFTNASNPFYFIVNLALGGDDPGVASDVGSLPGQLMMDWIRVWQKSDGVSYVVAPAVSPNASAGSSSSSSTAATSSALRASSSTTSASSLIQAFANSSSGSAVQSSGARLRSSIGSECAWRLCVGIASFLMLMVWMAL